MSKNLTQLTFFCLLTTLVQLSVCQPISAVTQPTPTPVALPTASVTEVPPNQTGTVNQNLKKVIDKVVEENKDVVTAKLEAAGEQRHGLVGQVKSVREGTITITTPKGTQLIPTDKDVQLIKAGKFIRLETIAIDDWVTVIGATKDGTFRAGIVVVSPQSLQTVKPVIALGTIEKISKTSLNFRDRASQDAKTWQLTKTTQWQDAQGNKTNQTNFVVSLQALFVGVASDTTTTTQIIRSLAPFARPTQAAR